jgi:hypothetical protein
LNPTLIHLKGSDLLVSLEKSLLPDYQNTDGRGAGFRGKWLGNLQVSSNVKVQYDPDAQPMESIKTITIDAIPLDSEKIYTVGTSDYLQRGTGYGDLGQCTLGHYNPEFLRETLAMYLARRKFRKRAFQKRFVAMKP